MAARNPGGICNRDLSATAIGEQAGIDDAAWQLWEQLVARRGLSTRSGIRLLRVARTVADLRGHHRVNAEAVAEASGYRCTDLLLPGSLD